MSLNTESTPVEATPHTFASVLREAFIGTTRDFTSGPILPALIILAIPMILSLIHI